MWPLWRGSAPWPEGRLAQRWHCPLIYWTRTLVYFFQRNSRSLSAQGTAQAHPRAFRNISTRPRLHCPGEGHGTLGVTLMPLLLVPWWWHIGTSGHSPLRPVPQVIALPHETYSPTPNTVQYTTLALPACPLPCPPLSRARLASPRAGGGRRGREALRGPPPDPGLPGMLQGSEPDTKSHGSH